MHLFFVAALSLGMAMGCKPRLSRLGDVGPATDERLRDFLTEFQWPNRPDSPVTHLAQSGEAVAAAALRGNLWVWTAINQSEKFEGPENWTFQMSALNRDLVFGLDPSESGRGVIVFHRPSKRVLKEIRGNFQAIAATDEFVALAAQSQGGGREIQVFRTADIKPNEELRPWKVLRHRADGDRARAGAYYALQIDADKRVWAMVQNRLEIWIIDPAEMQRRESQEGFVCDGAVALYQKGTDPQYGYPVLRSFFNRNCLEPAATIRQDNANFQLRDEELTAFALSAVVQRSTSEFGSGAGGNQQNSAAVRSHVLTLGDKTGNMAAARVNVIDYPRGMVWVQLRPDQRTQSAHTSYCNLPYEEQTNCMLPSVSYNPHVEPRVVDPRLTRCTLNQALPTRTIQSLPEHIRRRLEELMRFRQMPERVDQLPADVIQAVSGQTVDFSSFPRKVTSMAIATLVNGSQINSSAALGFNKLYAAGIAGGIIHLFDVYPQLFGPASIANDVQAEIRKDHLRTERVLHLGSNEYMASIQFSPDGKDLHLGTTAQKVYKWHVHEMQKSRDLGQVGNRITSLSYSLDGELIAVGDGAGKVTLFNPRTRQKVREFAAHDSAIVRVMLTGDRQKLLTAAKNRRVKLWHLVREQVIHEWTTSAEINDATFSRLIRSDESVIDPDSEKYIFAALENGRVQVFPTSGQGETQERLIEIRNCEQNVLTSFVPVVKIDRYPELPCPKTDKCTGIFTALRADGIAGTVDLASGRQPDQQFCFPTTTVTNPITGQERLRSADLINRQVNALAYSPDSRLLYYVYPDNASIRVTPETKIFSNVQLGQDSQIAGHTGPISAIAPLEGFRFIASTSTDGTLRIWDQYMCREDLRITALTPRSDEVQRLLTSIREYYQRELDHWLQVSSRGPSPVATVYRDRYQTLVRAMQGDTIAGVEAAIAKLQEDISPLEREASRINLRRENRPLQPEEENRLASLFDQTAHMQNELSTLNEFLRIKYLESPFNVQVKIAYWTARQSEKAERLRDQEDLAQAELQRLERAGNEEQYHEIEYWIAHYQQLAGRHKAGLDQINEELSKWQAIAAQQNQFHTGFTALALGPAGPPFWQNQYAVTGDSVGRVRLWWIDNGLGVFTGSYLRQGAQP